MDQLQVTYLQLENIIQPYCDSSFSLYIQSLQREPLCLSCCDIEKAGHQLLISSNNFLHILRNFQQLSTNKPRPKAICRIWRNFITHQYSTHAGSPIPKHFNPKCNNCQFAPIRIKATINRLIQDTDYIIEQLNKPIAFGY